MSEMSQVEYEGDDLHVLSNMPNYYSWIMKTFAPFVKGHVVEYGAGIGTVSELLFPLGERLTLVEPSVTLIPKLRANFADRATVEICGEMLEQHAAAAADCSVDTIVMINVLEHIDDDREALRHLVRMLRPGGHLLIFVPALQALMSEIDLMHGHFRRYHRPDLVGKVKSAGAHVIESRYFDFLGTFSWLVVNKWGGSTTFNPRMIEINDKILVPISSALETAISPPIGKNLIVVGRKPAEES